MAKEKVDRKSRNQWIKVTFSKHTFPCKWSLVCESLSIAASSILLPALETSQICKGFVELRCCNSSCCVLWNHLVRSILLFFFICSISVAIFQSESFAAERGRCYWLPFGFALRLMYSRLPRSRTRAALLIVSHLGERGCWVMQL